ncbi:MAG: hypothetical protein STSR0002_00260 [Smithella sp.]|jgi:Tfp pilus assembly protein PilV
MNIFNKKGMSIIECLVAVFLTTTAIISLMTMQSLALRGAGKSDYLGRANGILQRELELREIQIMHGTPVSSVVTCADTNGNTISCSSAGKMFTITYTMTPPSGTTATWLINVKLTWPGSSVDGIKSSMIVSRQSAF